MSILLSDFSTHAFFSGLAIMLTWPANFVPIQGMTPLFSLKAKKATFTVALINQLFTKKDQTIADPVALLQQVVMDEYVNQIRRKKLPIDNKGWGNNRYETSKEKDFKPYDEELSELER